MRDVHVSCFVKWVTYRNSIGHLAEIIGPKNATHRSIENDLAIGPSESFNIPCDVMKIFRPGPNDSVIFMGTQLRDANHFTEFPPFAVGNVAFQIKVTYQTMWIADALYAVVEVFIGCLGG
jgi:hypothetical protein